MKRPGGFDRTPDRDESREGPIKPASEHRLNLRGRFARDASAQPTQVPDPELKEARAAGGGDQYATDVVPESAVGLAGLGLHSAVGLGETPTQTADDREPDESDLGDLGADTTSTGQALAGGSDEQLTAVIEERVAKPAALASVNKALEWAGVGAPKDPVREADKRVRRATQARKRRERREKRRFTFAAKRAQRNWLIGGGVVLALALFVIVCAFTPLTAVRVVQVEGAATVPQSDIETALARFDGVPLALVKDAAVHEALEVFPLIQRYKVERIPPHTLLVKIEERVPVIAMKQGKGFDQYDAAGVRVGHSEKAVAGVPLAAGTVTDKSSGAFAASARALRDMPDSLRNRVTTVTAKSGQDVALTLDNGLAVVWGDETETKKKSLVLEAMMKSLGDRSLEYIDVSSPDAPVYR